MRIMKIIKEFCDVLDNNDYAFIAVIIIISTICFFLLLLKENKKKKAIEKFIEGRY